MTNVAQTKNHVIVDLGVLGTVELARYNLQAVHIPFLPPMAGTPTDVVAIKMDAKTIHVPTHKIDDLIHALQLCKAKTPLNITTNEEEV